MAWLGGVSPCAAQTTLTWDNNGATAPNPEDGAGIWNLALSNWWNGGGNVAWDNTANAGTTAIFGVNTPSVASYAVTVSGNINAGGLTFNAISNSAGAAYSFTGAGSSITLASGALIDIMDNASSTGGRVTFNTALVANNLTIRNSSGANSGFALLNLSGANTLTGTLTLQGNLTGGLFVSATVANALNGGASISVLANTTLSLNAPAGTNWTNAFTLTGAGSGARGAIRVDTGTAATPTVLSGPIALAGTGAAIYGNPNVVTNITGAIGDGGLNLAFSAGTATATTTGAVIILSGNNTFTGGLKVDGNEVRLNNAGAINATTPNVVTFTNNSINKVLSLNGTSVTAAGLVSSGGVGTITTQNANATAATLTIANSTVTSYGGSLTDGTGGGALSLIAAGSNTQTLSGAVSLTGTMAVNSGTLVVSGVVSATSGITVGGGVLTLSGPNTYSAVTGGTVLNSGTLNINNATALGSSVLTINGGAIDNTTATALTVTNNNAQAWNGDFAFTGTHSLNLGTGAVSLGNGGTFIRTITTNGAAATSLTIGGVISDGPTTNAITKAGASTLILSGANLFTGAVNVSTGILNIQNNLALGTTLGATIIADGAKLQMQNSITVTGESLTTGFLESVSGTNTWAGNILGPAGTQFTLQSDTGAGLTVTGSVNANGHTMLLTGGGVGEISGAVSGVFNPGGLDMNGTGTWVLSGPNNYSAPTLVNSGNLQVGKGNAGQTGLLATTVGTGGTLSGSGIIQGAGTMTGTLSPGDNGGISAGRLQFNAGLTFNPTVPTNSAALNITSAASADNIHVSGLLTLNSNSNFNVTFDAGYVLNTGDSWDLMDWTGLLTLGGFNTGTNQRTGANVGNEGNLNLPDLTQLAGYSSQVWQISPLVDGTSNGSLIVSIVVAPEPGRAVLLLAGAWGMVCRRRRKISPT